MKAKSINESQACLLDAGLLACNAVKRHGSFRARDLGMFVELFSNWIEPGQTKAQQPISNTHLARFLKQQAEQGLIRCHKREGKQRYAITSIGLAKVCKGFVGRDYIDRPAQCFFGILFIKKYLQPYLKEQTQIRGLTTRPLAQQLLSLTNLSIFIETQLYYLRQKQTAIRRQLAIFEELTQLLPEIDLTSPDVADILEYLEGDSVYFMHQHQPAHNFFRSTDLSRLISEIKNGPKWRARYMLKPELDRFEFMEQQLQELLQDKSND